MEGEVSLTGRRAKLVLLVLAVALVALGVWRGEQLYYRIFFRRHYFEPDDDVVELMGQGQMRGYYLFAKGSTVNPDDFDSYEADFGGGVFWSVKTGMKTAEGWKSGGKLHEITWDGDGVVVSQVIKRRARLLPGQRSDGGTGARSSPPWWWGVTDQNEPTMPAWMKDDEKWAKALEEAR